MLRQHLNVFCLLLLEHAKLTPFTLPILFILIFVLTLNTRYMYLLALVFANMFINTIIKQGIMGLYKYKKVLTLPLLGLGYRPKGAKSCAVYGDKIEFEIQSFGMPSGHSQIIWSIIAYYIFRLYDDNKDTANFKIYYPFMVAGLVSIGTFVSYSRTRLKCHTFRQVLLGGIIGGGTGIGAYYLEPHVVDLKN